jgi:transposase InsO family protein
VHELRQQYPIARLLKGVGLARSVFYYQRSVLFAADKHQKTKESVKAVYDLHKGRYGYRRITASLRQLGQRINHKTVQRLMEELGLKSLVRIKKYKSYKGEAGRTAPNKLKRRFCAKRPNQKLTTDITEMKVAGVKLYLSPVMDLFNGEIIAYTIGRRPVFEMVESMVKQVFKKLKPSDKPMLHSDQGWHYQMPAYQKMLKERQLLQSMSRKGNCHDNAAMESFFGVLKSELYHLNKFTSFEHLEAELAKYIHYYNHDRIKMKLGGMSPVQYRTWAAAP